MNYKVYKDKTLKTTVSSKTATITGLTPNTSYIFGVIPNNGLRDGERKEITVKTRGIRFNIPKTLTVGSTITLRYEEYPLGIVPIGNEPSGMFGGGNKKTLSAKVVSATSANSIIELTTADTSFADGASLSLQPDGTYALLSEYKALYY